MPYDELLSLPDSADWYGRWRAMPDELRHPIRTYTARGVRQERREVDVDIVLHGDLGPASRWALGAAPGDDLVILGPNADADRPARRRRLRARRRTPTVCCIAGDETALPAIAGILERLPADARGEALIEMPLSGDRLPARRTRRGRPCAGYGRDGRAHGELLVPAVQAACARLLPGQAPAADVELEDVDVDEGMLWEVPGRRDRCTAARRRRALRLARRRGRGHQDPAPAPGRRVRRGPQGRRVHGVLAGGAERGPVSGALLTALDNGSETSDIQDP